MTPLQSLERYHQRIPGIASPGWSAEAFGWCLVLSSDGEVVAVDDLHDLNGKKPRVRRFVVPAAVKRTAGIRPNRLWDKTAYVLGRTAGTGKRTADEHAAFVAFHLDWLAGQEDKGLVALRRFLETWQPENFEANPAFKPEMLDANVVFRLDGERGYLHERPAARALIDTPVADESGSEAVFCLLSGEKAVPARLHDPIKGVAGAQSSGAQLVSFNLDAFTSYGKAQGGNAPIGAAAASRYASALNHLLLRDGPNRLRRTIGDATVVFWADASNAQAADAADGLFLLLMGDDEPSQATDSEQVRKLAPKLEALAKARPIAELWPDIDPGTVFHVLGLAPNAARLSVRFWLTDTFERFATHLAQHRHDLHIDPAPLGWGAGPSVDRLLVRTTALQQDFKNIPNNLAGEVMRAVLTGGLYPQTLLSAIMIRLRAGDDPLSGWHAAVIRAVLHRIHRLDPKKEDVPVSLCTDTPSKAYQLGRLFAVLETAQRMALGQLNAGIRDRYFGAASATPASVFPLLLRGAQNHLGKLRKAGKGGWIEREIEEILENFSADLPRSLPLAEQGRFVVGYYHQRKEQAKARSEAAEPIETTELSEGDEA